MNSKKYVLSLILLCSAHTYSMHVELDPSARIPVELNIQSPKDPIRFSPVNIAFDQGSLVSLAGLFGMCTAFLLLKQGVEKSTFYCEHPLEQAAHEKAGNTFYKASFIVGLLSFLLVINPTVRNYCSEYAQPGAA